MNTSLDVLRIEHVELERQTGKDRKGEGGKLECRSVMFRQSEGERGRDMEEVERMAGEGYCVGRERAGETRVMGYVGRTRAGSAAAYITNAQLIC